MPKAKLETKRKRAIELVAGEGIEHLSPAELRPSLTNARQHDERQVKQLAHSIRSFGFNVPIVIDENNMIRAGHGRLMAANHLGLERVPVIRRAGLSETAWRQFQLADNRVAMNATWDMDALTREMKALQEEDVTNFAALGFADDEIKELLATIIEMPELGDTHAPGSAPSRDDLPNLEDANVAVEEIAEITGDQLAPVPGEMQKRYHQLPPDDASRAIRASEERTPLAILLNRDEYDLWISLKAEAHVRSDKQMWRLLVHLDEPKPKPIDNDTDGAENLAA
jgi:ParB-like chromosome segregation protein Spo0J